MREGDGGDYESTSWPGTPYLAVTDPQRWDSKITVTPKIAYVKLFTTPLKCEKFPQKKSSPCDLHDEECPRASVGSFSSVRWRTFAVKPASSNSLAQLCYLTPSRLWKHVLEG